LADSEIKGFIARRQPGSIGGISFGFRYRFGGRQKWLSFGTLGKLTVAQARDSAKQASAAVAAGRDPIQEQATAKATAANTINSVVDSFLRLYARPMGLRSARRIEQNMDRLVRPKLGARSIYDLRRSDLVALHDEIAADTPEMARRTLAQLQHVLRWHSLRDDAFSPPTAPGLTRATKGEPRDRVLSDQEIVDVWHGLDAIAGESPVFAVYARLVKALLLTARRRDELGGAHWREVIADTLVIPANRMKSKAAFAMPITAPVMELFGPPPAVAFFGPAGEGYIFSADGTRPFAGYSRPKAALNEAIAVLRQRERRPPMEPWTHHDLRRTGRSLMSRLKIEADIAERVLDHAMGGIRKVYDVHDYIDEKRDALTRLAALIGSIAYPPTGTVVPLRKA
jgi:integrase